MLLNKVKVAWVTGASGLLGSAVSKELRNFGYKVVGQSITRRNSLNDMDIIGDCRIKQKETVNKIITNYKRLDVLVCCAGGVIKEPDLEPEVILEAINKNLITAVNCVQAAMPHLSSGCKIILIGSEIVNKPRKGQLCAYTIAKAALHQYAISLAGLLEGKGISVNCIAPGTIVEPPKPGLATVNEFVRVVLNTISSNVTGQIIQVPPQ